ncbi:MAG: PAS domain S-box protein [Rhodothermaceae bacterium]
MNEIKSFFRENESALTARFEKTNFTDSFRSEKEIQFIPKALLKEISESAEQSAANRFETKNLLNQIAKIVGTSINDILLLVKQCKQLLIDFVNETSDIEDTKTQILLFVSRFFDFIETEILKGANSECKASKKFRQLIKNIYDEFVLFSLKSDGTIGFISPSIKQISGLSPDELTGKKISEIFITDDGLEGELTRFKETLPHEINAVRFHLKTRSRKKIVFNCKLWPVYDSNHNFISFDGIARDITEYKTSEAALKLSEYKYKTLLDSLPQKVFYKDTDSSYVAVNRSYASDLNLQPEDLIGKNDYDFFPKDLAEKYRSDDKKIMQNKNTVEFDESYMKDNELKTVHTVKVPVKDETGKIKGLLGIFWDITHRKNLEERLIKSEHELLTLSTRLQLAVKSAKIGIWDLDLKDNNLIWDDRMYELYGLDKSVTKCSFELWKDKIHPEDSEKTVNTLQTAIDGKNDYNTQYRIMSGDGEIKFIKAFAIVIRDENNQPLRMIGINYDITKRTNDEAALQKYADTQNVLLQEVNHRVKNNLAALISILHKEEDKAVNDNNKHFIPMLKDLQTRIKGLSTVHSLLSSVNWQPLNLTTLCEQIITSVVNCFQSAAKTKFFVNYSDIKVNINQAHHLTLAINELASNTFKHFNNKNETVEIKVAICYENDYIYIQYIDNGPGYPDKMLAGNMEDVNIGFGLIKGIVEQSLEGQVDISNNPGAVTIIKFKNEQSDRG